MRTTVDISDDAYHIAKTVAREQHRSMGAVVSDFITGRLGGPGPLQENAAEKESIFPTFRSRRRTTSEDVKALEDDE